MKKIYTPLLVIVSLQLCNAQSSVKLSDIPLMRQYFHENISSSQKAIMMSDGKDDDKYTPTQSDDLNEKLTVAITAGVNNIEALIEADSLLNNNDKIKFLRGLNEILTEYKGDVTARIAKPVILPDLLNAFKEGIHLEINHQSIIGIISNNSYETGNIIIKCVAYSSNPGVEDCRELLTLKYVDKYPDKILTILSRDPDRPYADSLIVVAARRDPDNIYTFAAAHDKLAMKIQSNPDSLVKIICQLSKMSTGRQFFPFLDNLYHGKTSFDEVEAALNDSTKYYSLLVQTEIDYADRMRMKDTPLAMETLTNKLAYKAKEVYVNEINGLHESPDNIRFKIIDKLSPNELYFLAVLCEEEIYTSSYVRGVYPRVWQPKKMTRGDSLLMGVRFDHFKKWIKMAANYNTLDNFLSRMNKDNSRILMKAFVNGLDRTNSLEDAVDVANSFASIYDKNIRSLILDQVQYNLDEAKKNRNKKASNIYNILNTLFLSMDSSNNIDVSKTLGIPPVYFMPNKLMQDSSGKIIIQQFFYGDKDGKSIFSSFINSFSHDQWKITNSDEWVVVSSTKGVPVVIYSNKPLDEDKGLDDIAQQDLCDYLNDNNIEPTFVIHRGHSYYLNSTLKRLAPSAKVILLGSCGGYQSLKTVLETCPTAQIIASKQTGAGNINQPMISFLVEALRSGKDLNWPKMWNSLDKIFSKNSLFDDYVPPHKNLGAVFIMAYNKLQEEEN